MFQQVSGRQGTVTRTHMATFFSFYYPLFFILFSLFSHFLLYFDFFLLFIIYYMLFIIAFFSIFITISLKFIKSVLPSGIGGRSPTKRQAISATHGAPADADRARLVVQYRCLIRCFCRWRGYVARRRREAESRYVTGGAKPFFF